MKALLTISILLLTSFSHLPSSLMIEPKYVIKLVCWIGLPSNVMLILGDCDVMLITIVLVFLIFFSMPYGLPVLMYASNSICKFFGQRHKRAVLSAYLKFFMLMPFIIAPFTCSTSLNIFSVYRLKRIGDRTYPCHTSFLISNSFDTSEFV